MAGIDSTLLHQYFTYKDGHLYNKKSRKRVKIGQKLGYKTSNQGYIQIGFKNKYYYVHRLIFLMFHNYLPEKIDHIDGNPLNNCIENLRACTSSQNQLNKKLLDSNTSGFKNVHWRNDRSKWRVDVVICGKRTYFGSFDDIELADLVAQEVRNKYHKEFARHK